MKGKQQHLGGYTDKLSSYFEDSRPEMVQFIPTQTKRLLEIGCGRGAFSQLLKDSRNIHVTAIEPFPEAAKVAAGRVNRLIASPIETALNELDGERFDCVVMNDVLEHLVDPWLTLRGLLPYIQVQGLLVASIPNVRFLPVLKDYVLRADWKYHTTGVLDQTHLRFFTYHSMRKLFDVSGYDVLTVQGINAIKFPWKYGLLNLLTFGALEDSRFMQFACVARPRSVSPGS